MQRDLPSAVSARISVVRSRFPGGILDRSTLSPAWVVQLAFSGMASSTKGAALLRSKWMETKMNTIRK